MEQGERYPAQTKKMTPASRDASPVGQSTQVPKAAGNCSRSSRERLALLVVTAKIAGTFAGHHQKCRHPQPDPAVTCHHRVCRVLVTTLDNFHCQVGRVSTVACGGVEGGGVAIPPAPAVWKVGWVSGETAKAPDSRCAVTIV